MAQTGYTPILIYSSSTAAAAPVAGNLTNSTLGSELAINITDGKLFYKDNANAIQVIGWKVVPTTAGGTGLTSFTANQVFYASSSSAIGQSANLTFNGTTLGVGGAVSASRAIFVQSTGLTGTTQTGVFSNVTGSSAATSNIDAFRATPASAAAAFTVANMSGLRLTDGTKGAGSTITSLRGILIDDQTQGNTNNIGIDTQVSSGANKWNIYASGTAANYFAGNVGVGTTSPDQLLHLSSSTDATLRFESTSIAILADGVIGAIEWESQDATTGSSGVVGKIDYIALDATPDFAMRFFTQNNNAGVGDFAERMRINNFGNVGIGTNSPAARLHLAGAITASSWTTNGIGLRYAAATYTDSSTAASGTVASSGIHAFAQPTIAASNATVTYTNAATLYVANSPANGTNVTVTNPFSLWVDNGATRLDGNITYGGLIATQASAPTVASAATIAPTTPIVFVSGTTQINTITAPAPISANGGQITLIPTGLWTTGITGNIAIASTAVVSRALIMTYDATTTKWYPSY